MRKQTSAFLFIFINSGWISAWPISGLCFEPFSVKFTNFAPGIFLELSNGQMDYQLFNSIFHYCSTSRNIKETNKTCS